MHSKECKRQHNSLFFLFPFPYFIRNVRPARFNGDAGSRLIISRRPALACSIGCMLAYHHRHSTLLPPVEALPLAWQSHRVPHPPRCRPTRRPSSAVDILGAFGVALSCRVSSRISLLERWHIISCQSLLSHQKLSGGGRPFAFEGKQSNHPPSSKPRYPIARLL